MADRERIFDRYYRSAAQSNRTPGTALPSVAKRVAVIHGGYVWVTSDEIEEPRSRRDSAPQRKKAQ